MTRGAVVGLAFVCLLTLGSPQQSVCSGFVLIEMM